MTASREERRQAARTKAEKLRQEQAARERRSRNILIGVLVGIVALVAVVGVFIFQESKKTLLDDFAGAKPANADNHGGIVVGATGTAGEKTGGGKNLQVYLDFMCPYCGDFEAANATDLDDLRASGGLNVTYHVMSNLDGLSSGTAFSTRAANAAATVASESPEHFVAFVEGMFANQPEENSTGLTDEEIASIAVTAGVPQEVADTFAAGTYTEWVGVATQQAKRDGVGGTPTVLFNGKKVEQVAYYTQGELATWLKDQGVSIGD
ncbi:protein-disulfide isomerase [Salana multivorans]|uniref:Protein-disulfide isomerase n=1 Tax=Salana multivorans TaxID=120377 RepID=A0A3N2D881_9MICO|nr:thioredoxin domain-containing protein [Salana multivorans]MBN8881691.1 thioredoxin domain-containing protein [Salana multivorans]OJX93943.1 MAG: hypothetical protein BGO96_00310 [Micrococcales bacterium 73-15]ROR95991.1 protein-disulfide isomerase [Salana multivorans]